MSRSHRSRSRERAQRDNRELSWYRADLHIHTPASADYLEPDITLLDILRKAEARGADLIAFTDHNTVRGYATLKRGIENLELLETLDRITPEEKAQLDEYRRLVQTITVIPGVEFTATFGFHILGLFSPETSIRHLEHTLLLLNIPEDKIDAGSGQVGATTDVLSAYETFRDAGALVIPAHVNSTNGVAMQNLPFGGQTKIAFTQSTYIHALEATDLESSSRRSTSKFFNGSKPDYPRRMHVIQGSDAHRLNRDPDRPKDLGVGDRMTEMQLPEPTFEALQELLESDNFGRTRPYRPSQDPYDFIRTARAEGDTIVQAFHARPPGRRGRLSPILRDVVALANGHGGSIFVGVSGDPKEPATGVKDATAIGRTIREDVARHVTPPISVSLDVGATDGKQVLILSVPGGADKPYAVAPGNIYVRQEGETTLALRDEIVELAKSGLHASEDMSLLPIEVDLVEPEEEPAGPSNGRRRRGGRRERSVTSNVKPPDSAESTEPITAASDELPLPRTGVEIVESVERDGVIYHAMRDLRNLKVVQNVTRDSARKLWRYAIIQKEQHPCRPEDVTWANGRGFWKAYKPRGANVRFNLAFRNQESSGMRVFYGVTEDGLDREWRALVPAEYAS